MFIVTIIECHGSTPSVVSKESTFNIFIYVIRQRSEVYFPGLYVVLFIGNRFLLNDLRHSKYIMLKAKQPDAVQILQQLRVWKRFKTGSGNFKLGTKVKF